MATECLAECPIIVIEEVTDSDDYADYAEVESTPQDDDVGFTVPGDTSMPHVIEALGGLSNFEVVLSKTVHGIFKEYGLSGWDLVFDRCLTRAGLCDYKKRHISISRHFVQSDLVTYKELFNIIFHEIAHAITPGHGHDDVWRQASIALGGDGHRLCQPFSVPTYKGFCKCEGWCHFRYKISASRPPRCRHCSGTIVFAVVKK
jgi:predicted SprT family Zn-dependent metalloprotease